MLFVLFSSKQSSIIRNSETNLDRDDGDNGRYKYLVETSVPFLLSYGRADALTPSPTKLTTGPPCMRLTEKESGSS